ncbi:MAG: hypothetical protein ACLGI3_16805 [Actinomycetes bacterium]
MTPADVLTTPTDQPSTSDVTPPASAAQGPAPETTARPTKAKPKRGKVVSYAFTDPITGAVLDGIGVAVDVPDDGQAVCVAPIAANYLFVPAEGVQVVELDG